MKRNLDISAATILLLGVLAATGAGCGTSDSGTAPPHDDGHGDSGSDGGACEVKACVTEADCPGAESECVQSTCIDGCCGTANVAEGTVTTKGQTKEDCKKLVCDGHGATKTIDDEADTPAAEDDCHVGVCVDGAPSQERKAPGAACSSGGGRVCASSGQCVECIEDGDCANSSFVCAPGTNTCVPIRCADGVQNGDETDKDCGGGSFQGDPACPKCAIGKVCNGPDDCETGHCKGGVCAPAPKPNGESCDSDEQCDSGLCIDQVCCDTACDGMCEACNVAGKVGTCSPIPSGADPDDECEDEGAETCGKNGSCDGAGACELYAAGTVCRARACEEPAHCPGGGAACPANVVLKPSTTVCRPYAGICDKEDRCTGWSADCPNYFVGFGQQDPGACDGDNNCTGLGIGAEHCGPDDGQTGAVCGNDTHCNSRQCVNGKCQ